MPSPPALAAEARPATAPLVTPPDPVQLLQQMFDTLAQARQLTFKATRQLDAALVPGGTGAESADIELWVSRPQMLRARAVSDAGIRAFYADGQRVSLIDEAINVYATTPLAALVDHLPRKFVTTFKDREGGPQLRWSGRPAAPFTA